MSKDEYILGTGDDELARLGFQHRLWSDAAHALWRAAGIRPGHRVLDLGCGPGFGAFDLASLVGRRGRVVALDMSEGFVAHANQQAAARDLPHLVARTGNVEALAFADGETFDIAYARWVLCFVAHPERVIAGVVRALAPGGRLCVHDYFNYETMTAAPRRASYTRIVQATAASWRSRGGDPDVVGRLPRLLAEHGMRVDHLAVHQRIARPGDTMWHWATTWWRNYVPKLVDMKFLEKPEAEAFFADLEDLDRSPHDFIVMPPVYEIMATKI